MKLRVFATLATAGVLAAAFAAGQASAAPSVILAQAGNAEKKKASEAKPKEKAKRPAAVGELGKKVALSPRGLKWGMSLLGVAKLYDKEFDDEFAPLYKKVEPGTRMQALDAELTEKKALIRRNKVEFGKLPTGVDQGPLKGEYSYNNGESMTRLTLRSGTLRHFFFFNDKLWKVYDDHKLRKGGTLGEKYEEAMQILTKKFGSPPKVIEQDFEKGRNYAEAHWQDGGTLIRAVNREPVLGMVYVDRSVQEKLATLRKNKPEDPHAIDRDVANVTRKPEPEADKPKPEAERDPKKPEKAPKKSK
ncbi:MAG TPA: hypothetical protein VK524_17465 [Polyangiaceae bacterium]|nr:hypothetical protein [Polyangiaceae bacterium]